MAENNQNREDIRLEFNSANSGLDMDKTSNQVKKGVLTYALNAGVENYDANSINYQNEPGNEFCVSFPEGFTMIGDHFIQEKNKHIFFITNDDTKDCQLGYMENNDCIFRVLIDDPCLGWDIRYPIHKIVHKITNCSTEIYWPDNIARRYLDIDNIPYIKTLDSTLCDPAFTNKVDCNQLKMQPNFNIPQLYVKDIIAGGNNTAGTVQFAAQYSDADGNPYTNFYSITTPTPLADTAITTPNFNYNVGKSVVVNITNLDETGMFQYFNLAVIKKVNDITSVELVGTYYIDSITKDITYSGQNVEQIRLTINDIFEKYPYYDLAQDITVVEDILVWDQLTTVDRINFQKIANQIPLYWETYRIPASENYSDELNATNLRSYLRDEIYALEFVPLFRNGKQGEAFHIPGRAISSYDTGFPDVPDTDPDFIGEPTYYDNDGIGYSPYWKIYNTARIIGPSTNPNIGNATAHEYGEFAYWESEETYPCNENVWGELAGKKIRHHKFPDVNISPIYESKPITYTPNGDFAPVMGDDDIFPIGIRINPEQIQQLIISSPDLTSQQKQDVVGFKIVRGNRGTNKSIVGKGILRNIASYERDEQIYYFANYPYNEIGEDPFLNQTNNAFAQITKTWLIICLSSGTYEYGDPNTNKAVITDMVAGETYEICSTWRPIWKTGQAEIGPAEYDVVLADSSYGVRGYRIYWEDPFSRDNLEYTSQSDWLNNYKCVIPGGNAESKYCRVAIGGTVTDNCKNKTLQFCKCDASTFVQPPVVQPNGVISDPTQSRRSSVDCSKENPLFPITPQDDLRHRQIFNSPETSFGQPFLGNVLKLESVIYGGGKAHFVEVKKNAKYKLLSKEAQEDAIDSANKIGAITDPFNAGAMFAAYQAYLTIYINGITRRNYAYSYNSIADYNYLSEIPNSLGVKQRMLDLKRYLIPGVQSVGEENGIGINNYQRESSVYLRTDLDKPALPFPSDSTNLIGTNIKDVSRKTIGESKVCNAPGKEQDISVVSYYASLKNTFPSQWGQIYSYDTVDTGYQALFEANSGNVIFGGDTFISRFSFKTKIPFFTDNRVGAPDDSDIFYDEIGNVAYPKYWHSARSILEDYTVQAYGNPVLKNFISYKAHNFDCPNDPTSIENPEGENNVYGSSRTYYDGYFYLFAYGQPNFYCESSYNLDLRQAFNNKEGDFWPHVSTSIPDDWVQESFVSIANDNTYTYNVTYSTQNKENTFTHLPQDWEAICYTNFEFRGIYSEKQFTNSDVRVNNWLIYRPLNKFDFPQNFGKLISLDGIQNRAVLARFENKSLMYNNLLTLDTSNPQAAYLGNPRLFEGAPPIDFAETDLGYVGTQNKFLLKIPQGQVTIDAKRGQIFLISGTQAVDLTAFGSGVNRFMTDHLAFEILRYFKDCPTDNHYNGIGIHGVYDSKFDRIIITKLDYIPIQPGIIYDSELDQWFIETLLGDITIKTRIYLTDTEFFCNKSWTMSFNFNTKSWISFHSYIPNWYIGENNFFYSGINSCCGNLDASFSAIVGDTDKAITTTTTTTGSILLTTTTTTTLALDCSLEGTGYTTSCELEGTGVITVPASTTTTICQRPILPAVIFISGYQIDADPPVDTSTSLEDSCNGLLQVLTLLPDITPTLLSGNCASLEIGQVVYYDYESLDCTLFPDGWYFTEESMYENFVYHIEGGVIVAIESCSCETTTTTTTLVPDISECCGILFDITGQIYYSNPNESADLMIPGYYSQMAIGMAPNKFWSIGLIIEEWDISLSPFIAIYNRNVALPLGFVNAGGIVGKNNTTIFAVDGTTPQTVVEMSLLGSTAGIVANICNLPADRTITTNMLYAAESKLIFGSLDTVTGDSYIVQIDIATGTIEFDVNVGVVALQTIFECNCKIYLTNSTGDTYLIDLVSPFGISLVGDYFTPTAISATQLSTCIGNYLSLPATTTTTTTL